MGLPGYDAWKTSAPPDPVFVCADCEDAGCLACCEAEAITLEDLEQSPVWECPTCGVRLSPVDDAPCNLDHGQCPLTALYDDQQGAER